MAKKWAGSKRRKELPKDWSLRRLSILQKCGYRCEYMGPSGARCKNRATDVDHAIGRMDHRLESLQGLCETHHNRKTGKEARAGKVAARRKGARTRKDDFPGSL